MNHLVPIQITLQAANAADVKQLVHDLAGTMSGMTNNDIPSETSVSTVQPETPSRTRRTTKKEEPKTKPTDTSVEDTTDSDAEEFLESAEGDAEIPSVEALRAKALEVGKTTANGKQAVKALLDKFECSSISNVPDEKRLAFMTELEKLL